MDAIKVRVSRSDGKGYAWAEGYMPGRPPMIIKADDRQEALGILLLELSCTVDLTGRGIDLDSEDAVPDEIIDQYDSQQY